ncbi:XapX domain-containing protein [Halorarum salinum]|uniref:XapX domain-containing protein n=1 Tax=Halorarum salinum TaxID=2743089 RepID=A0A7D5LA14_9EURY|nr:XapX domain-containing protein [Halobaculum salinum]QLG61846.1 XapX domain-containing protein [Halobaculum salinum]
MEWLKAAVIALAAGSCIGAVLSAAELPSPAPEESLGVVAGAFTLCGMYIGHAAISAYF